MNDPVQIRDEDGKERTVQRSSLALYLRRGFTEITTASAEVERAEDTVPEPPTDTDSDTPDAGIYPEEY